MKTAIEVFGEWAKTGRDERMAKGHQMAVSYMLEHTKHLRNAGYTAIDAGCGNGWVVRLLSQEPNCRLAMGVDGAQPMIDRALKIDPSGTYVHGDLMEWSPETPVDFVHSMEVFYYFREPGAVLKHILHRWMKPEGHLIFGVDHYAENTPSLDWAQKTGIDFMTTLSQAQWVQLMRNVGFIDVQSTRIHAKDDWAGTLVVSGQKPRLLEK